MSDDYFAGLHAKLLGALDSFLANTNNCACSTHVADLVMALLREERHNLTREGVTFATQTLQDAITITRTRYQVFGNWPEPKTVLNQARQLVRAVKRRAEAGTSLGEPELEALAITTPKAQPDNQATPPTEGDPS